MGVAGELSTQKCWDCNNYFCSWRHDGTPVKGWKAKEVPYNGRHGKTTTYAILDCPEFESGREVKLDAPCCKKCSEVTKKICKAGAGTCRAFQEWRVK